jgi:hypothetical protein
VLGLVRALLEMGCLGWAAVQRTPRAIRRYVWMQLAGALVLEVALAGVFGDVSNGTYTGIYVVLSLGVYWTMGTIVREVLDVKPHVNPSRAVAFVVAGAMTAVMAGTLLGHVMGPFDWLTTLDAAMLVFMGVCVGMGAAKQTRMWQHSSLVLMAYWFAQALFEIGLQLHLWTPDWMRANQWFPAVLTCAGCVWVSYISRLKGSKAEA